MGQRLTHFVAALALALASPVSAQEGLPKSDLDELFEVEPPLLIPNRDREREGQSEQASVEPGTMASIQVDLGKLEKDFERAKRLAGAAEKYYRMGVLAKAEVEQRTLRMIRLQAALANARLSKVKEDFAEAERNFAAQKITKEEFRQLEETLALAISAAHTATAKSDKAEIEAAELNLQRQQKLLSLGSGRKSEVARAEQKLAELKASKN